MSLFSGGGGLDLGFHLGGFDIVLASDIEEVFVKTLDANRPRYVSPTTELLVRDIRGSSGLKLPKDIDFVIGGPPCQSFSASGRRAGGASGRLDPRGTLFEAYCDLIAKLKPQGFLFENVRGILGTNDGRDWTKIVDSFKKIGYDLSYRLLDACDYGIAQHRERLILVGHKPETSFEFPAPTHGPDSHAQLPHITPRVALSRVSHEEDLKALKLDSGKYAPLLREVPRGDNYLFFTAQRGYPKPIFAYRSRFSDFLYKANPDRPIKTLIASPGKYTGPFHWSNRGFSIGEYKRLQGFPDDYQFCGSRADVIRQIGNSVSPKIALALADAIAVQIFGIDRPVRLLADDAKLSFDQRKGTKARSTRAHHDRVATSNKKSFRHDFKFSAYVAAIPPAACAQFRSNVMATAKGRHCSLIVIGDGETNVVAELQLRVFSPFSGDLFGPIDKYDAVIDVEVRGEHPNAIQTAWNAIDDLVIRSSNFHSLFELYGHFTEPHPVFEISKFVRQGDHPIFQFAEHVSHFANCSRYFPRRHLVQMFGSIFGTRSFTELVTILRGFRFDIRCHETNVAIPKDVYMVAYPFTLPYRRQMNVGLKKRDSSGAGPASAVR